MRKDGQITVFLSLVLVCVLSLLCGLLESARTAGARYYLQMSMNSSMQSVFGQYNSALWEKYRILGLWCGMEGALEKEITQYLTPYLENSTFYPSKAETVGVNQVKYLTDNNGIYFEQEILDYMKYGIWTMDIKPEEAESVFNGLMESVGAGELSDTWRVHMKHTVMLEKALENILICQKKQEDIKEKAEEALGEYDGSSFKNHVKALINQLERIPSLVEKYKSCASKLKVELERTRLEIQSRQPELGKTAKLAFEEEMAAYESYVREDGSRMQEIESMAGQVQTVIDELNKAIEKAESAQEYIDSWEPEDEEDELDEGAVWEPVRNHFSQIVLPSISCKMGVQDKESQGLLEKVEGLINLNLLSLVVPPERGISNKILSMPDKPSRYIESETSDTGEHASLADRLFVGEYGMKVFPCFLTEEEVAYYEAEYILGGKESDKENLNEVVKQLLLLREGANLTFLLTNSQKRSEAQALAASIVGVTGIAPLVMALTFFILSVWALGESITDIKHLLSGSKIPLFKTSDSWSLSLQGLLEMGKKGDVSLSESNGTGFSYEGYLKLLLFFQSPVKKRYRMMDLIQMNIRRLEAEFCMKDCVYSAEVTADFQGKHIFLSLPLLNGSPYPGTMNYKTRIKTEKSY